MHEKVPVRNWRPLDLTQCLRCLDEMRRPQQILRLKLPKLSSLEAGRQHQFAATRYPDELQLRASEEILQKRCKLQIVFIDQIAL